MNIQNLAKSKLAYNIENDANIISKLFFLYISPIFKKEKTRLYQFG